MTSPWRRVWTGTGLPSLAALRAFRHATRSVLASNGRSPSGPETTSVSAGLPANGRDKQLHRQHDVPVPVALVFFDPDQHPVAVGNRRSAAARLRSLRGSRRRPPSALCDASGSAPPRKIAPSFARSGLRELLLLADAPYRRAHGDTVKEASGRNRDIEAGHDVVGPNLRQLHPVRRLFAALSEFGDRT